MATSILTAELAREILKYDPESGVFTWSKPASNRVGIGSPAGYLHHASGYIFIRINRRMHKAHRLAWLYMTGQWPIGEIDHIDGDRTHNAFKNLRDVCRVTNAQNLKGPRSDNKTGYLGVSFHAKAQKFEASIRINGARKYLGLFVTAAEAHAVYLKAKRSLHEGCTI